MFEPELKIMKRGIASYVISCCSFVDDSGLRRVRLIPLACYYCVRKNCTIYEKTAKLESSLCPMCEYRQIEFGFKLIFDQLRKSGLLPKDFEPLCCICYAEKKVRKI